ncbi:MAG: tetratricopeptide repeat protein [Pedosphaera sp.]|nr:tetratricopeptide repeat protein [Pedosphaera sp.]
MSKNKRPRRPKRDGTHSRFTLSRQQVLIAVIGLIGAGVLAVAWQRHRSERPGQSRAERSGGSLTFSRDVAPIVFEHCTRCHQEGQSAPFPLTSYAQVKKHSKEIVKVTASRYMPPWLPESGFGEFAEPRLLTAGQIGLLREWVAQGAVEGAPGTLVPSRKVTDGWQLGQPDLVITMPQAYTLPAEGRDVYRNFVIPIPTRERSYVAAVEFRPDNPRIVHHAFMKIDRTRYSARLDEQDPEPGFSDMKTPASAQMPEGQFLTWQPGKVPSRCAEGFAWTLEKGSDFVLQLHLNPTGKPETVRASIGFYFTDKPPLKSPFKICLLSYVIDIPAGQADYLVADSYELPVDLEVYGVLPHAHYLGKDLRGFALLPDGSKRWLIWIRNWDFNWQGDYRYKAPVFLPKGTKVCMEYRYDNSAQNPRNPNTPPLPVAYGYQSTNEMAELWFQTAPLDAKEGTILADHYKAKTIQVAQDGSVHHLRINPQDFEAHMNLGMVLDLQGKISEAAVHFQRAVEINPLEDNARYLLGVALLELGRLIDAQRQLERAVEINPDNFKAFNHLGMTFLNQGNLAQAERCLREALRLNPEDPIAGENLDALLKAKGRR